MILSTSGSTAAVKGDESWTIRALLRRHKLVSLGLAALIAALLATILVGLLGPKAGAVSDASTCTQWGAANQDQQAAYGRLYLREHGPLRGGNSSPASVIAAINTGCAQAYGDDVSDSATVVQAISGRF